MKTKIITTAICLTAFFSNASAQNAWTAAPANNFEVTEPAPAMLSRTETFFGAELEYTSAGATVKSIIPNSPAAEYNFKPGDVISLIGNTQITSEQSYQAAMDASKPGDRVKVIFKRNGTEKSRKVTLEQITRYKAAKS